MKLSALLVLCCILFQSPLFAQDIEVFVSSSATNSIKVWNKDGIFLGDFINAGSGTIDDPQDILFHPDGSVLISGFNNSDIKRFDGLTGTFLGDFSSGYFLNNPSKMSIGPDSLIYITQWTGTQKVVRFDLQGNFVDEFTNTPVAYGLGHFWDENGIFYIAAHVDGNNGFIEYFDTAGNSLGAFHGSAKMDGPTSIWRDQNKTMYIADWTLGRVIAFDSVKNYLGAIITNNLVKPEGFALGPNKEWLIGDWTLDKVQMFDSTGAYMFEAAVGEGLQDPTSVKIRPSQGLAVPENKLAAWFVYQSEEFKGLTLKLNPIGESQKGQVKIFDMQSKLVHRAAHNGEDLLHLPLPNLSAGTYVVSLSYGDFNDSQLVEFHP